MSAMIGQYGCGVFKKINKQGAVLYARIKAERLGWRVADPWRVAAISHLLKRGLID